MISDSDPDTGVIIAKKETKAKRDKKEDESDIHIKRRANLERYTFYSVTISSGRVSASSSPPPSDTAAEVNASFLSLSLPNMTHCVVRPVTRTSARGTRIVCPDFEMRMTLLDSFSSTVRVNAPIIAPVFSVVAPTLIPDPPLPCSR